MSYDCKSLLTSNQPNIYVFTSTDSIGTITSSNYIQSDWKSSLYEGDMLFIQYPTNNFGIFIVHFDGSNNIFLIWSGSYTTIGMCDVGRPSVSVSGTTKTLALTDAGTFQNCSNGSTQTITVPPQADIIWLENTEIDFAQMGAGQVVIAPGNGVTINSAFGALKSATQYAGMSLHRTASNTWLLVGNLTA